MNDPTALIHPRVTARISVGIVAESQMWEAHGDDIDAYINAVCSGVASAEGIACPKCKSTSTRVDMLQTRSADEGMSAFLVCTACSFKSTLS